MTAWKKLLAPPPLSDAPTAPDAERLKAFGNRVGDQVGHELFNAYLAVLKSKADVKINQANLDKK